MKLWTVNSEFAGKFLPIIDGAKPNYGGFDFRVSNSTSERIEVVAGCDEARRWLPSIEAGILEYCGIMEGEGERFCGIKIEITKIYSHESDTTDEVMKYRGLMFLHGLKTSRQFAFELQAIEE